MLGLYLLILLVPFAYHPILGMKLIGSFTLIKLVGAVVFLYALVHRLSGKSQRLFDSNIGKLFFAFTLVSFASFILFYNPYVPHGKHHSHISFLVFFVVTLSFVVDREKLRKCLWACVFAMAIGSYSVIKEGVVYGAGRPGGGFGDANIFGANAVLMFPIAYFLLLSERKNLFRITLISLICILITGILFAKSRGAAVGFLVSLLIMAWQSSKKLKAFLGLALFLVIIIPFVPAEYFERMGMFGYEQKHGARTSAEERKKILVAGVNMIKEYPLLGVGLDNFYFTVSKHNPELEGKKGAQAHNGYIEITAELGIPGFLVFASMLVYTFLATRSAKRRARVETDHTMLNYARGLEAGLVGFLVCCFFVNAQYEKFFWLTVFLIIVLEAIRPKRESLALAFRSLIPAVLYKNKAIYSLTFRKRFLKGHAS
jgi:O-antigen ligase